MERFKAIYICAVLGICWVAAVAVLPSPSLAQDGKLLIGAAEIRTLDIEYSDGRREQACRVVFTLTNRTGRTLSRARFWVRAANGKREAFGLNDRKTQNRERFDRTACDQVRGKLTLVRARCQWASAEKPSDCSSLVHLNVK